MKSLALVLIAGLIASANCQSNSVTAYVENLWAKTSGFFVAIPGEDVTVSNFNATLKTYDVCFEKGWFWMSDIASNHKLNKASIKSEFNDVNTTIKFNVDLKGCQIGWMAHLYKDDTTSDLSCSFDLDTIPYEFVVTKNKNTNKVEVTFKFAGMHSPRMIILASMYLPPRTEFAMMLKDAMNADMEFLKSMGDVFASITKQGQVHVDTSIQMVDFPNDL